MSANGDIPAIDVRSLTAGYEGHTVLEDISFTVRRGEVFVILGGSGCGKSTLLRHLVGLAPPISGTILINGRDLTAASDSEREGILSGMGVLFQSGALFGSLSLADNIRFPLTEHAVLPAPVLETLAGMKLRLVGLEDCALHMPGELSGGQKKRGGLARALALEPEILFFDEPSAGLDPLTSATLDQTIVNLNRSLGLTIVVVTHELPSIFTIAHRVIMLDPQTKGIIAEGDPRELRDHSTNDEVRRFLNRDGA
ncbi:ATP-binding cassette domain-containing protein [bacterium]|nr:ATP-binding cassette domain-containing protein [bacterium]